LTSIEFISKGIDYQIYNKLKLKNWLKFVGKNEKVIIERLDYFFVSENKILEINNKFLGHNYKTDIITFSTGFISNLSGEIFICIDVVKENSQNYSNGSFENELLRVIVHGLLHIVGYKDHSMSEIKLMREKEDFYLNHFFCYKK
jgi:probable rRNA maturation factor